MLITWEQIQLLMGDSVKGLVSIHIFEMLYVSNIEIEDFKERESNKPMNYFQSYVMSDC
jgi:hypothetical protein